MKKCFVLLALMLAVCFASPVSEHGKLSVSGRKILDKNNNEYVLRGMSMYWNRTDWPGGKFYRQSTVTELAGSNWNANVVRAAIGNGNLQDAKNFMDWTKAVGIYVIIDWHYHDLDENGAKAFFSEVSKYAKDNNHNHVIYEIFNEPISQGWAQIKTYAENVIDVIRANDPDGLIIVGTPNYSADIGSARSNPITASKARNVLYSLHFYSSEASHATYMTSLRVAWCADFPVFISEFGTSKADGGKDKAEMDKSKTDEWMSLVESRGVSWANWSLSNTDESSAALTGGCCSDGTFSNNNLSTSGRYIQNIMKGRNNGAIISSVGLTQQNSDCGSSSGSQTQEKDGIIKFKTQKQAVNFLTMSGMQDSVMINDAPVLKNSASTFNVGYTLTEVPEPGAYKITFRYGTTASNATVSWQGTNLETGSLELPSTNAIDTWKTESALININGAGSTPLNLAFDSKAANNFAFVSISVGMLTKTDSLKYGLIDEEGNIVPIAIQQSSKQLSFEAFGRNLLLHKGGDLEIYSLSGKRAALFLAREGGETIALQNLPSGTYIAVLRKHGQVHTKTIYLK